jgi:hypothetical protein
MKPVTITITDEYELQEYLRVKAHGLVGEVVNLAVDNSIDHIVADVDGAQISGVIEQLEAAKSALEAIHGERSHAE